MIFLINMLQGVAWVLDMILRVALFMLFGRVIISCVNAYPYNGLVRFITGLTDPPIRLVKRYIPTTFGGFDISVLIVMLIIGFLQFVLVKNLYDYAFQFERA